MSFSRLVTYLFFLLPLVYSRTLYIDKTCTDKPGWGDYWKEVEDFTSQALKRVKDDTDESFNQVFIRIFRTTKDSKEGKDVQS